MIPGEIIDDRRTHIPLNSNYMVIPNNCPCRVLWKILAHDGNLQAAGWLGVTQLNNEVASRHVHYECARQMTICRHQEERAFFSSLEMNTTYSSLL